MQPALELHAAIPMMALPFGTALVVDVQRQDKCRVVTCNWS